MPDPNIAAEQLSKADSAEPKTQADLTENRSFSDGTYDPSEIEATRGRQQGLGMGQKDIDRQQDATGAQPDEREG